jgi:hypothetical protein
MSDEEKREFTRLRLPFKGRATFSSHGQREVETKDISAGSAYIIADICLDIGERVTLLMQWPSENADPVVTMDAEGTVYRVEPISESAWGCVVNFDEKPDLAWKK